MYGGLGNECNIVYRSIFINLLCYHLKRLKNYYNLSTFICNVRHTFFCGMFEVTPHHELFGSLNLLPRLFRPHLPERPPERRLLLKRRWLLLFLFHLLLLPLLPLLRMLFPLPLFFSSPSPEVPMLRDCNISSFKLTNFSILTANCSASVCNFVGSVWCSTIVLVN